jgi:hypothetical protein
MTRKARLWIGATLLVIIAFNYAALGYPLMRRSHAIQVKSREILIRQVKSDSMLKGSEDEYILDLFKKERISIDRNIHILNIAAATLAILIGSWTAFGLIFHRK